MIQRLFQGLLTPVLIAIVALLFVVSIAVTTSLTFADTEEHVLTITTNAFSGVFGIDVTRDDTGVATGIIYQTPASTHGVLALDQLNQSAPAVIFNDYGHEAILFNLESDFNATKGGHADIRYLRNGILNTYRDFRFLIDIGQTITLRSDPNPNDADSDDNSFTGPFNSIFLEKNTILGITVGISQVVPSLN